MNGFMYLNPLVVEDRKGEQYERKCVTEFCETRWLKKDYNEAGKRIGRNLN